MERESDEESNLGYLLVTIDDYDDPSGSSGEHAMLLYLSSDRTIPLDNPSEIVKLPFPELSNLEVRYRELVITLTLNSARAVGPKHPVDYARSHWCASRQYRQSDTRFGTTRLELATALIFVGVTLALIVTLASIRPSIDTIINSFLLYAYVFVPTIGYMIMRSNETRKRSGVVIYPRHTRNCVQRLLIAANNGGQRLYQS
jgi:hypothetical protein